MQQGDRGRAGSAMAAALPAGMRPSSGDRMHDLVALFEVHNAVADPVLLAELARSPDGAVRAQSVLASLVEVPFHFDRALWTQLEQRQREALVAAVVPAPAPTTTPEAAQARKEAM